MRRFDTVVMPLRWVLDGTPDVVTVRTLDMVLSDDLDEIGHLLPLHTSVTMIPEVDRASALALCPFLKQNSEGQLPLSKG
jgi:hypothetical protein